MRGGGSCGRDSHRRGTCAARAGSFYKYDLSLPVGEMYSLVEQTRERMAGLPVTVRSPATLLPVCGVATCMHCASRAGRAAGGAHRLQMPCA